MSLLRKNILFTYIPADPGSPGDPGSPYIPAYCKTGQSTADIWEDFGCEDLLETGSTTLGTYTTTVVTYSVSPVYSTSPDITDGSLSIGGGSYITGYVSIPSYTTITVPIEYGGVLIGGSTTTTSSSFASLAGSTLLGDMVNVESCINYWNSTGTVDITCTAYCGDLFWTMWKVCYPEQPARPAIPPTPPTPAELITNFQEGWNASAQSIESLMPGKAALFRVGNGSRGVLLGFAPEPWVPSLNTLPFGVMYSDGAAQVFENGVFKEDLGYFFEGQEFIIGRTLDNYIMYINKTDGYSVARRKSPAAPTDPIHLFAVLYYGGDNVWI